MKKNKNWLLLIKKMEIWSWLSGFLGIIEAFLLGELWMAQSPPKVTTIDKEKIIKLTNELVELKLKNKSLKSLNDELVIQGVTYLEIFNNNNKDITTANELIKTQNEMLRIKSLLIEKQNKNIEELNDKIYKLDEYCTNVDKTVTKYEKDISNLKLKIRILEMKNGKYVTFIKEKNMVNDYQEWVNEFNKRI
jgi:hypothetical protein